MTRFVETPRSSYSTPREFNVQVEEFNVQVEEFSFGWAAQCPQCQDVIEGTTQQGTVTELANHINERHYAPPRGNA